MLRERVLLLHLSIGLHQGDHLSQIHLRTTTPGKKKDEISVGVAVGVGADG